MGTATVVRLGDDRNTTLILEVRHVGTDGACHFSDGNCDGSPAAQVVSHVTQENPTEARTYRRTLCVVHQPASIPMREALVTRARSIEDPAGLAAFCAEAGVMVP